MSNDIEVRRTANAIQQLLQALEVRTGVVIENISFRWHLAEADGTAYREVQLHVQGPLQVMAWAPLKP